MGSGEREGWQAASGSVCSLGPVSWRVASYKGLAWGSEILTKKEARQRKEGLSETKRGNSLCWRGDCLKSHKALQGRVTERAFHVHSPISPSGWVASTTT